MYLAASAAEPKAVRAEVLRIEERLIQARNALIEFRDSDVELLSGPTVEGDVARSIYQNLDAIGMLAIELTGIHGDAPQEAARFFQGTEESKEG